MAEEKEETAVSAERKLPVPKVLLWVLAIMAGLALILYVASYLRVVQTVNVTGL